MKPINRIITIQDLSTFGRCSLSVVLPTLSILDVQCCPVPTAVFSTHTGGLGEVTKRDLSDFLAPTLAHYQQLELDFSAVYTGYLGSVEQFASCLAFFDAYPQAIHMVDPVMGDHGIAYRAYTPEMQGQMKSLVAKANLITPNLTEVCILLGRPYTTSPLHMEQVEEYLSALAQITAGDVVITGVRILGSSLLYNACYEKSTATMFTVGVEPTDASFPGTGDIFASVLIGNLVNGTSLCISVQKATSFTALAVSTTNSANTDSRYGVVLERVLPALLTGENLPKTIVQ